MSRSRFRRALRGLSGAEFARFVAALWAARGWQTTLDGDIVIAEDGAERRVLLTRHAAGWRPFGSRRRPRREDVTDVVTSTAADRPGPRRLADDLDARLHGPDDLYDRALYGLDRDTADALLEGHLGHPAIVPERAGRSAAGRVAEAIGRVDPPTIAVAVVLLVATVAAGFVAVSPGGDGADTVPGTPVPVEAITATPTPDGSVGTPRPDAWAMFRADLANTGRNDGTEPPSEPIRALAAADLGAKVVASPAVANGTVYVGTTDTRIYALDGTNATVQWRRMVGGRVTSSPAVVGGTVYFGIVSQRYASGVGNDVLFSIRAVRAADGSTAWYRITHGVRRQLPSIVPTSSPAVANGTLYVGGIDRHVYAIGAATGRARWTFRADDSVLSSPAVANDTVYAGTTGGTIYALDTAGGERWNVSLDGQVIASPAVANGTLYVGTTAGSVYALDTATGAVRWSVATNGSVVSSAAIGDGVVIVGSEDAHLYGLSRRSGRVRWTSPVDGRVVASPALVAGTAYVGTVGGRVYAIDAATGSAAWSFPVDGRIVASPAVADGRVYAATTTGTLYVLGEAENEPRNRTAASGPPR